MANKKELTYTQRRVLGYLLTVRAQTGNWPTRREISRHFGWVSPNASYSHLLALRDKGWLDWDDFKPRCFKAEFSASLITVREFGGYIYVDLDGVKVNIRREAAESLLSELSRVLAGV